MEYHRYLKEVIQALESDAEFREKLEKANEGEIRVSVVFKIIFNYRYYEIILDMLRTS